jgi:hypothetical protein
MRRLVSPGRWSIGGVDGLVLQVTVSNARRWVLRLAVAGEQREMGLGSFPTVTLAGSETRERLKQECVFRNQSVIVGRAAIQRSGSTRRRAMARSAKRSGEGNWFCATSR